MTASASSAAPPGEATTEATSEAAGELAARAWQGMRALVLDRYDRRKMVCDALGMSFIRAASSAPSWTPRPELRRRARAG